MTTTSKLSTQGPLRSPLSWSAVFPVSIETAYRWHLRPQAQERLLPAWQPLELQGCRVVDGDRRLDWNLRVRPFNWKVSKRVLEENRSLLETHHAEPWMSCHLRTHFQPQGPDSCRINERLEYRFHRALPFKTWFRAQLELLFRFRRRRQTLDFGRLGRSPSGKALRVAVSGASGLIGTELTSFLQAAGHQVIRLVRRPAKNAHEVNWYPQRGQVDAPRLEGLDGLIHLAGKNIACPWTSSNRQEIRDSRVEGTRLLATTLARLASPPECFLCSSAVGFYGDRGQIPATEQSDSGRGFLARVCREWEAAAEPARQADLRVAHLRTGMVVSLKGGILSLQLPFYRLGLGAVLGEGDQYLSWISLEDIVGVFYHALRDPSLVGPINAVAPHPVPQAEFARELAHVLARPFWLKLPAFWLKRLLGKQARMLLDSQKVLPTLLADSGYRFCQPHLRGALEDELGLT